MSMNRYPAEFVFPGHPDKLSDAIADGRSGNASNSPCPMPGSVHSA